MPGNLSEYNRKRNFTQTREPKGQPARSETGRAFVIQKHAARRLHYDLRLELDGVLLSWAVPKGPGLTPGEKHLAVQVEDHPVEYGSFEGVIPPGQYGAGTVQIWDRGQWFAEGDARKAYRAGKLKFRLEGEKLHGHWALIRMAPKEEEPDKLNWLLIKEKEHGEGADHPTAPIKNIDKSVATGRTMDQIAHAQDAVWQSDREASAVLESSVSGLTSGAGRRPAPQRRPHCGAGLRPAPDADKTFEVHSKSQKAKRAKKAPPAAAPVIDPSKLTHARKAPQPEFVRPQLATLMDEAPKGDNWVHEIKFDGYRLICVLAGGRARFFTRRGNDWTDKFPTIARALEALPAPDAILDGELVVVRSNGTTDFQTLQNSIKFGHKAELTLYLFDVMHCGGYDLCRAPQIERKDLLKRILDAAPSLGPIRFSDHLRGSGPEFFNNACRHSLEGIMCKRVDAPYESKRGRVWLKLKCVRRQEFVIGGYTDPAGAREKFGALLLGYHNDAGELVYCGRVGTGFSEATLDSIHKLLEPLTRKTPAFVNPPKGREARGAHWVEPRFVGEVEYIEMTNEGILRHPSFKGLREDKPAKGIKLEKPHHLSEVSPELNELAPLQMPKSKGKSRSSGRRGAERPSHTQEQKVGEPGPIAGVTLSNPDRILYPNQGVTKLELARYYESIGEWITPYVRGRPLTLVRCPQGHHQHCFYQKHISESVPAGIHGIPIREKEGEEIYLIANGLTGIISLAQLGVLEIHIWGSREDKIELPDMMIFDLDPDPAVPWGRVIEAAFLMRDRLAALGLESFVKTTGGKGLHVVAPLVRRADNNWDVVKEFSKRIAENVVKDDPARFTANMSKAKRQGKIYIDYVRNSRGATSIAAYSTRAREGAPVSTPLSWDELKSTRAANEFTIRNIPDRLRALKTDPWADFFKTRQSLTAGMKKAVGMH